MRELAAEPAARDQDSASRQFSRPRARGHAGTPAVFPPLPADAPADRLALARWLVDQNNPLTARVIANRYWEQIFGIGIVATSEEFGSQGESPVHPELLDWLATELAAIALGHEGAGAGCW